MHCEACCDTGSIKQAEPEPCFRCRDERAEAAYWFLNDGMIQKLLENIDKGHWEKVPFSRLMQLLGGEILELRQAISGGDAEEILREAADVANFAMMIADNARRNR